MVHPLSTALFLLGYGLALPIGMNLGRIAAQRQSLALAGHQIGVILALVGWLLRGSLALAAAHVVWLIVAGVWFQSRRAILRTPTTNRTRR